MKTTRCLPRAGVAALAFVGGLAVLLVIPTGCLFRTVEPPSRSPEITGEITKVEQHGTSGVEILIEEQPGVSGAGPEVAGDKMWVWVTGSTRILVREGDSSWRRGGIDDLRVGVLVQAWPTDIVDTDPQRGSGGEIAILGPAQ